MTELEQLKKCARKAGEFMRSSIDRSHTEKSNAKDFVTVADIKSQDIIRAELRRVHPDAVILSEEDSEDDHRAMFEPGFTGYILDPIDGTYNFKRGMQESAISIGYIKEGQPVLGVIYDPYKDECYTAEKGKGAYCNDEPISVSNNGSLQGSSIATSNSYDDKAMERNLKRHLTIYEQTGIMPWTSCPGSGVLIMAWIACGRIDAYHHNGLKPWDNAAAFLLVREAGGDVQTLRGEQAPFTSPTVLMGNKTIVQTLQGVFSPLEEL